MKIYELINEDMMNAGGPMGSETTTRWRKNFLSSAKAKKFAQADYDKTCKEANAETKKIKWNRFFPRRGETGWSSEDLMWVMYEITPLKIEDDDD